MGGTTINNNLRQKKTRKKKEMKRSWLWTLEPAQGREFTKITGRKKKLKERDYSSNQLDGMTEMKPINLTSVHLVKINGGTSRLINVKIRRIICLTFQDTMAEAFGANESKEETSEESSSEDDNYCGKG